MASSKQEYEFIPWPFKVVGMCMVGFILLVSWLAGAGIFDTSPPSTTHRPSIVTGADYTGTNFTKADLRNYDCTETNFTNADLSGADLRGITLSDADLTNVKTDKKTRWGGIFDAKVISPSLRDDLVEKLNAITVE